MESNSNKEKSKGLLYKLRHFKIRNRTQDEDGVTFRRSTHSDNDQNGSSIRKSLRKMHTRIRNCVSKQINRHSHTRHTFHSVPEVRNPAQLQPRITLESPNRTHMENIYSASPSLEITPSEVNSLASPVEFVPSPPLSPRPQTFNPKNDVLILSQCYWYWGPVSRSEVERRLASEPDGSFLIRDSTSDRYIFTLSFRSVGKTLHARIEHNRNGYFLFDQNVENSYGTIKELVENAVKISTKDIFCFTKTLDLPIPNFPVRLLKPVSRYSEVKSLKHLTRFAIRRFININDIEKLPLPVTVIQYLQEETIF